MSFAKQMNDASAEAHRQRRLSKPAREKVLSRVLARAASEASEGYYSCYFKPWFSKMRETEFELLKSYGFSASESVFGGVWLCWRV